ncbi:MAG: hypothetical protein KAJ19_24100 [Gammaproteobacteria bacterium]|nr:hypothetical protein [Gammaproteobacteria bacterium]
MTERNEELRLDLMKALFNNYPEPVDTKALQVMIEQDGGSEMQFEELLNLCKLVEKQGLVQLEFVEGTELSWVLLTREGALSLEELGL